MKGIDMINKLPAKIKMEFIYECKKQGSYSELLIDNKFRDLSTVVDVCITWSQTRTGSTFWVGLKRKLTNNDL